MLPSSGMTLPIERPRLVGLVCLGYNAWSAMWKRTQSLVAALARQPWVGPTLFLNPDVWLGSLLRQPRRQLSGVARAAWRGVAPYRAASGAEVFTICRLPFAERLPVVGAAERRLVEAVLRRRVAEPYVLLVNRLADPGDPIVARLFEQAALRVFDWSDDFEEFAENEAARARMGAAREFYLRESDLVLAVNEGLGRRARAYGRPVLVVRNATHYEVLARAGAPDAPIARPVARLPRPVLGYMGYLCRARLDTAILETLADRRPDASLVFLGPLTGERPLGDRLPRAPNVHLLPPVPYERLPSYLAGFDVCLLPNRINACTDGNDPLKLYDYLATGKPIVATRTAGTEGLERLVRLADGPESFLRAVDEALTEGEEPRRARQEAARAHSWDARVRVVAGAIRGALGLAGTPAPGA